jgi:uncharacterized protein (DUF58 family)
MNKTRSTRTGWGWFRQFRPTITTRLTRHGWQFAALAAFVLIGAVLRDLNLLVILAGLMLGMLAVQWRFCRRTLDRLRAERLLPTEVFAGEPWTVRFRVHNDRWLLPTWALRIEDTISGGGRRQKSRALALAPYLPAGGKREIAYPCRIMRRGAYQMGPTALVSGFPFGLMVGRRWLDDVDELTVYPAIGKLTPRWSKLLTSLNAGLARATRRAGPYEGDFFGLRPWQHGDSRRWIHWRTTARLQQPAVRQFEQQRRDRLALVLDLFLPGPDPEAQRAIEHLLSFAATILQRLATDPTNQLALAIAGNPVSLFSSLQQRDVRQQALAALAKVEGVSQPPLEQAVFSLLERVDHRWPCIVLSTRANRWQDLSQRISRDGNARLLERIAAQWIDTRAPETEQLFQPAVAQKNRDDPSDKGLSATLSSNGQGGSGSIHRLLRRVVPSLGSPVADAKPAEKVKV